MLVHVDSLLTSLVPSTSAVTPYHAILPSNRPSDKPLSRHDRRHLPRTKSVRQYTCFVDVGRAASMFAVSTASSICVPSATALGTSLARSHPTLRDVTLCSKCSPKRRGVAVVGASTSPDKLGYQVLHNIIQYGYEGGIYPINPTAPEILGLQGLPIVLGLPRPGGSGRDPGAQQSGARRAGRVRPARPQGRGRSSPPASARSAPGPARRWNSR